MNPNPNNPYPIDGNKSVQFIKPLLSHLANVEIGEFTYYDSKNGETFDKQILYHYSILGDKLIIGKFCSLAPGVTIMMNGGNHRMDGSTYPFNIFGNGWEKHMPSLEQLPIKGDTVIGNDVWIGRDVVIMPGVKIGDGAIIAANSVVVKDIEPYAVFGGNPARKIKDRFKQETVERLLNIKWWNLPIEVINENIQEILNNDLDRLEKLSVETD